MQARFGRANPHPAPRPEAGPAPETRGLADVLRSIARRTWRWYERRALRDHLNRLDDRALADIGLARADIAAFVARAYGSESDARAAASQVLPFIRAAANRRVRVAADPAAHDLAA
jgi:uncharacterized protein YjiS (DUF1127 family)